MARTATDKALRTRLSLPHGQAVEKVVSALKEEGFGILTQIDVKATLKEKLDADFRRYVILGACNPPLAHQALNTELEIGQLLPCNVIVYDDDGDSVVAILDPRLMARFVDNPELDPVAQEARTRLERVIQSLQA